MQRGRGRISAIEKLPPECDEIIAWASNELRDRDRDQIEIYQEFRERLQLLQKRSNGELEFDIPSKSAFNRYSIKLAVLTRRFEDAKAIAAASSERLTAADSDNLTVIAAEALKTLVFEILTGAGEAGLDPKEAMQLGTALKTAAQAQGISTARVLQVTNQMKKDATTAIDKAGKAAGLTSETIAKIRREFLGVQDK